MNPTRTTIIGRAARIVGLVCALVMACFLVGPMGDRLQVGGVAGLQTELCAFAQVAAPTATLPPAPNTRTPAPAPSDTRAPTDTPLPSNTPLPLNTPTDTSIPTQTETPAATQRPVHSPTPQSPAQPPSKPPSEAQPDPNCQSMVQGIVYGISGQPAQGATVILEGAGRSNSLMTDDAGSYGFGGLCAGSATLRAYLASGQASSPAQVSVNGRDSYRVDLRTLPAGVTAGAAPISTGQASTVAQPGPTAQPDMPATGYSGWLLVGGALLGSLLLLSAGVRRALGARASDAHSRPQSNQK